MPELESEQKVEPEPESGQEADPELEEYEGEEYDDRYDGDEQPWPLPPDNVEPRSILSRVLTFQFFVCAVLACAVIGMATDFLLHRYDTGARQLTGDQVQGLQLDGAWFGPDGAVITLSGSPGTGTFTFTHIPSMMFVVSQGDWPAGDNDGTWALGQMQGSQWSESGLVLRGSPAQGASAVPQLMLLPIGSASSPQLACYFPVNAGVCVFKRR